MDMHIKNSLTRSAPGMRTGVLFRAPCQAWCEHLAVAVFSLRSVAIACILWMFGVIGLGASHIELFGVGMGFKVSGQ